MQCCVRKLINGVYIYNFFSVVLRSNCESWPLLTWPCDHTSWTHHTRSDSSGRVISPIQRPLPGKTLHSQETDIHAPEGFKPTVPTSERARPTPQTALPLGSTLYIYIYIYVCVCKSIYILCIYIYI